MRPRSRFAFTNQSLRLGSVRLFWSGGRTMTLHSRILYNFFLQDLCLSILENWYDLVLLA